MMINWQWCAFEHLTGADVYAVLMLRQQVFILEQECMFADIDGFDPASLHLLGWQVINGERCLVAYLRCLAPGVKYAEMSLGRVVTAPQTRGTGIGKQLMQQGIAYATARYPGQAIRIGAQHRLARFYQDFGFEAASATYLEDDIVHIDMLRAA